MAVPFNIPDEQEESSSAQNIQANSPPVTPTRPISIPAQNRFSQSSQQLPMDNEVLVQAFYEALCRCSQISTPSSSTSSSPTQTHFWFPQHLHSPSQSNASSPRNSFRSGHRRRLNSYGSQSQYSQYSEDFIYENDSSQWEQQAREEMDEFEGQVPKSKNQKKKSKEQNNKNGKITNFVISALQFVIDTLK